jgi:hypothetical protein
VELREDKPVGKQRPKRYYKEAYGGRLSSKMPKLMPGTVMFVRGLVNRHAWMSCPYILFGLFKHLRNEKLTL